MAIKITEKKYLREASQPRSRYSWGSCATSRAKRAVSRACSPSLCDRDPRKDFIFKWTTLKSKSCKGRSDKGKEKKKGSGTGSQQLSAGHWRNSTSTRVTGGCGDQRCEAVLIMPERVTAHANTAISFHFSVGVHTWVQSHLALLASPFHVSRISLIIIRIRVLLNTFRSKRGASYYSVHRFFREGPYPPYRTLEGITFLACLRCPHVNFPLVPNLHFGPQWDSRLMPCYLEIGVQLLIPRSDDGVGIVLSR